MASKSLSKSNATSTSCTSALHPNHIELIVSMIEKTPKCTHAPLCRNDAIQMDYTIDRSIVTDRSRAHTHRWYHLRRRRRRRRRVLPPNPSVDKQSVERRTSCQKHKTYVQTVTCTVTVRFVFLLTARANVLSMGRVAMNEWANDSNLI